jgi:deazaflavin-dependent oxidoreductase (nitroreductase family)
MVAPRPRPVRPFTNRVINPILRRFAAWIPGFAILRYVGRKSGRTYEIPLKVFRDGDDYVIALTYGREVQWVSNVVATGRCELRERRKTVQLANPRVFTDPSGRLMPAPVRAFMRLLRVTDYVRLSPAIGPPPAPAVRY